MISRVNWHHHIWNIRFHKRYATLRNYKLHNGSIFFSYIISTTVCSTASNLPFDRNCIFDRERNSMKWSQFLSSTILNGFLGFLISLQSHNKGLLIEFLSNIEQFSSDSIRSLRVDSYNLNTSDLSLYLEIP